MRGVLFLLIFGLTGLAILVSLGLWQMQRLNWKQGVLADITTRIAALAVPLPASPDPTRDAYLPVTATGTLGDDYLRVLVSRKNIGAGYRIISALDLPGGAVLLDRGFVPADQATPDALARNGDPIAVVGNLQWPQETDSFTPPPDTDTNIWFARDVPAMAAALGTRQILIVAREASFPDAPVTPMPVDTSAIPNDHLQYALTWFSLALIWAAMTAAFLWRGRAKTTG